MFHCTPRRMTRRFRNSGRRYRKALRHIEALESRTLLSATATLVNLPDQTLATQAVYAGNELWMVNIGGGENSAGPSLVRVENGVIAESYTLVDAVMPGSLEFFGGHLFVTDFGVVHDFDLNTRTFFTPHAFGMGENGELLDLAGHSVVTADGGMWWVGNGSFNAEDNLPFGETYNFVVRFDTASHEFDYTVINNFEESVKDSKAAFIAVQDEHSVFVGLPGVRVATEEGWLVGTSRIATVAYFTNVSEIGTTGVWTLDTGDANTDVWGTMTGLAGDTDGSVWISFGNFDDGSEPPIGLPAYPTDRLVNVKPNPETNHLDTLATVILSDETTPLGVGELVMDSAGRLWFNQALGQQLGYFDTFEATVTLVDYPAGVETPFRMAAGGNVLTMLTIDGDPSDGYPIVQVVVEEDEIEFSGSAFNQSGAEDAAIENILLATFTAPAGTYTAVITWGDGTTETVEVEAMGETFFAVKVSSKTFSDQGVFAGSISVLNAAEEEVGTLAFSTTISDTALTVTGMSVVNPMGKFAFLTLSFTDDIDSEASWFDATITWGDGATTAGLVIRDITTPGQFFLVGSHKYKKKGTFTVTASIFTSESSAVIATPSTTVTVAI